MWDLPSRKERRHFQAQDGPILSVVLAGDGKTLAVAGLRTIRLWNLAAAKEVRPLGAHHLAIYRVAFSPDGRTVATGSESSNETVCLWDATTGKELHRLPGLAGTADLVTFSPDGRSLAVGRAWQSTVDFFDTRTGAATSQTILSKTVRFLPSLDRLMLAGTDHETVNLWGAATGKAMVQVLSKDWSQVALSADGKLVACDAGDQNGTILLRDLKTGREIHRLQGYPRTLSALVFSSDGKYLAGAFHSEPRKIVLWETATGAKVSECQGGKWAFTALTFSPEGKTLASAGWDATVQLWEVVTGKERRCFRGHVGPVLSVAFSSDGRRLVSGGDDTTALVWDVFGAGPEIDIKDLEKLWANLAHGDAAPSYEAVARLVAAPELTVAFLRERLKPVAEVKAERLAQLIGDLDSESFAVRQQAKQKLEELVEVAEPALRQAHKTAGSAEVRRRAQQILEKLSLGHTPERLREFRAIEVLEVIATPEARQLLDHLAKGASRARQTQEARASLARLARKFAAIP
jgi:WD40 repeat protein